MKFLNRVNIREWLILSIAFFLPLSPRILPFLIIILVSEWCFDSKFVVKFKAVLNYKYILLFISLYIAYLIGMFYTSNLSHGFADLETKLTLLLMPLLFSVIPINRNLIKKTINAFLAGNFTAITICFSIAIFRNIEVPYSDLFVSSHLSYFLQISYFAMYLTFACFLLLQKIFASTDFFKKVFFIFLFILASVFIFLLSSKMGVIALILVVLVFLILQMVRLKRFILGGSILGLFLIFSLITFFKSPIIAARFMHDYKSFTSDIENYESVGSSGLRVISWKSAFRIFSENPFIGVGTGDFKDKMLKHYEEDGYMRLLELQLNAHNQFLQTAGSLGIVGLIILLSSLLILLYLSIKHKNIIYFFFLFIIMLNFTSESMLERQAGVIFYAFFNSLLFFSMIKNKTTNDTLFPPKN
ncbi:MAG: O-antigen ligase family protein [Bacteroidetes bacterium]|nr:O-antigen ligase family protein [Bacteroidota bacterium]